MRKSDGIVFADANVHHMAFGEGQTVTFEANFTKYHTKKRLNLHICIFAFFIGCSEFCADGKTLLHDRFGKGTVFAYIMAFKNHMIPLTYPA